MCVNSQSFQGTMMMADFDTGPLDSSERHHRLSKNNGTSVNCEKNIILDAGNTKEKTVAQKDGLALLRKIKK